MFTNFTGVLSQVQKVRLEIDQGNLSVLDMTEDVYIVCGALKLFFRELQEPLIPWDIVEKIHINTAYGDEFDEIDIVKECLNEIPIWHRVGLKRKRKSMFSIKNSFIIRKKRKGF